LARSGFTFSGSTLAGFTLARLDRLSCYSYSSLFEGACPILKASSYCLPLLRNLGVDGLHPLHLCL
jgi:hypothetical protein